MSRTPTAEARSDRSRRMRPRLAPGVPEGSVKGGPRSLPTLWPGVYRGFPAHDPPASWHVSRHVPSRAPRPSSCYPGFARASDGSAAGARLRLRRDPAAWTHRGLGAPEHPALDAPKHWRPTSRTVSESPNAAVLVVDDVPENRDLLVRRLKRLGINDVEQAANGIEALAAIERKNFDLVLLDIMMPELDGFGVLERLKQSGRINDLPVVVISALNEIEPVVRCVELGAEDFIFKPFNPTLLRARVMASLEKKALRDRTRDELRRKQMELDEARTLQLALVPAPLRDSIGGRTAAVDAVLEPAKEVGGDLVDHFRIGEDLLVVSVGDVSDKGAGAALMMARTHALVRGLSVRPDAAALFREPEKAVSLLNAALAKGNDSGMFVTLLLGTLDFAGNRLAYVRAGHVPPYLRRADGSLERLEQLGGPPLGWTEKAVYKSDTTAFAAGDAVLVLTDGFTEAADPAGQLFGEDRIATFMQQADPGDPGLLSTLVRQVRDFEGGMPPSDDMAAILLSLREDATG